MFRRIWMVQIKQKMTLICLKEGSNDIIAMNVNYVTSKGDMYADEFCAKVNFIYVIMTWFNKDFYF